MESTINLFFVTGLWGCAVLMFLAYPGYPLLLALLATLRIVRPPAAALAGADGSSPASPPPWPALTVFIPAYNEAAVIAEKIRNTLAADYPHDKLQIIVISDASSDDTEVIVRSFAAEAVELIVNDQRQGKTYGLNRALPRASGELLIFTDADAFFEVDTLKKLVRGFADPRVGLVTGSTRYFSRRKDGRMVFSMGLYTRFERWVKRLESRIASCVGADGAVFAVRKELYQPLATTDINDLVIPFNVVRQGFRVIFDDQVYCREEHTIDLAQEFSRQIRISNRTVRALLNNVDLLDPRRSGHFSWMLFCHKWLRFLFPALFLSALAFNLAILFTTFNVMYLVLLMVVLSLLLFPFLFNDLRGALAALIRTFVMTNIAILVGWKKVLLNETIVTWSKTHIQR